MTVCIEVIMAKSRKKQLQNSTNDSSQIVEERIPNQENSLQKEILRGERGTKEGLNNYEQALGSFLGPKLYEALAPHLSHASIGHLADQGLQSLFHKFGALGLENSEGIVEPEVIDEAIEELIRDYGDVASTYLQGDGAGIIHSVGSFVDDHPRLIVIIALLAAAAAVLTDMDIPELKAKFKITDDLESSIGVKLGSFQNIALEQIQGKLKYHSNNILAAVQVTYNKDEGVTTNAKAGFEDDKRSLTADVTLQDGEISAYGLEGSLVRNDKKYAVDVNNPIGQKPNVNLTVETKEGVHTHKSGMNYDAETNSFATSNSFAENVAGGTLYTTNTVDGTRGFRNEAEWEGSIGDGWDLRTGYADQLGINHQRTTENSLGFTYTGKELIAELDARYNTEDVGSYEGSLGWRGESLTANTSFSGGTNQSHMLNADVEKRFGAHKLGGDLRLNLSDNNLEEIGAFYGFKGSDEFSSFLAQYRYNLGEKRHNFDLTIEKELMDIRWRGIQKLRMDPNGFNSSTEVLGAKALNDDISLIGGGRYDYNGRQGRGTFIPEVGIQYKEIPIVVEYNPEQKSVGVRMTLKF